MSKYELNGRIGLFLSVNGGTVEGCVADVSSPAKLRSADFVYENNAKIVNSIAVKGAKRKQTKQFCLKNTGSVAACDVIATPRAHRVGSGNADAIRERLSGTKAQEPAGTADSDSFDGRAEKQGIADEPIPIRTAQDLKNMILEINSGSAGAAQGHYRLENNINMKGARLKPIGFSESCPFTGIFDGNGKTVRNFTVDCRGSEYGGFFGCTKNARVSDLTLDYILKGKGAMTVGGMAGSIVGGSFENCQVRLAMSPGMCSGGFCGRNKGVIRNCYVGGKIAPPVPILPWLIPSAAVLLVLLTVGAVMLVQKLTGNVPFKPEIIDPNQVPVTKPEQPEDPLPAGTNRISLELNHEVYVSATTMVGEMDYVNPHRSTQDVVIRLCVSDAELKKAGYDLVACKVRTQKELNAEGYDAEKSFTVLYSSQRLQIGYKLGYCKLSALPNGETLKVGDYEMIMMIDAYDPETNEKAIVNAQAMTTIHIVDQ